MHLRSVSVGFCFLCRNVELYILRRVTNSPHPCCRWYWFLLRRDCGSSAPPDISCIVLPHRQMAAAWSSIHVAGENNCPIGTAVKVIPEGPSPPACSRQSRQVITEPSLRSFLQVRRRKSSWRTQLAVLCHSQKVQAYP